jgi:hypothetical protein
MRRQPHAGDLNYKTNKIVMACASHAVGAISSLDSSRLGLLEADTQQFTPRTVLIQQQQRQQSHSAGSDGFCRLLAPGDIYVGTPGMGALCSALASQQGDRLQRTWNTRVQHDTHLLCAC